MSSSTSSIVRFEELARARKERDVYARWCSYYGERTHEELLEALVHEHENGFPLRSSSEALDQQRHKALVDTLQERAQTDFLKAFLTELQERSVN